MTDKQGAILIIDGNPAVLSAASLFLKQHYPAVATEAAPARLPALLAQRDWDLILLDTNFDADAGNSDADSYWLDQVRKLQPEATLILTTSSDTLDATLSAMQHGATDFILKPWHNERLLATIRTALLLRASQQELRRLRLREKALTPPVPQEVLLGSSAAMRSIIDRIARAAPGDANVLILGENGSGKKLVARELFRRSARSREILVTVDLATTSELLVESELFGQRKGSFTAANQDHTGRLQAASGGTLLLHEIGKLPLQLQSKLLTALEQRQLLPAGSNTPVPIDVRLICTSSLPLLQLVHEGRFRADLLYHINTVELQLPALRERAEDVMPLLEHFIAHYSEKYRLPQRRLAAAALSSVQSYAWPGNVRELAHAAERAVVTSNKVELDAADLLPASGLMPPATPPTASSSHPLHSLHLDTLERQAIAAALQQHAGNVSQAARALGITRTALYRRMDKHGL
jgi:DNA-binding NtrC family response regulator